MTEATQEQLQAFEEKYRVEENGCWQWNGSVAGRNAPYFKVGGHYIGAKRWIYQVLNGDLPNHRYLKSSCKNPLCVNPAHLAPAKANYAPRPERLMQGPRRKQKDMGVLELYHHKRLKRERAARARNKRCAKCGELVVHAESVTCRDCNAWRAPFSPGQTRRSPEYIKNRYAVWKARQEFAAKRDKA